MFPERGRGVGVILGSHVHSTQNNITKDNAQQSIYVFMYLGVDDFSSVVYCYRKIADIVTDPLQIWRTVSVAIHRQIQDVVSHCSSVNLFEILHPIFHSLEKLCLSISTSMV